MPAELSDDPYATLGVTRAASAAEIKEAYRRLAKATHPDIDARPDAMASMVRINHAYELLADPLRRSRWDALNPVGRTSRNGSGGSGGPTRPGAAPRPGSGSRPGARTARGSADSTGGTTPGARSGPSSRADHAPAPGVSPPLPTLDEAFAFRFGTGKYQGRTIRDVVVWDRGYVEWVARTARDRPRLALAARKVLMHLDELEREAARTPAPAMGTTTPPPGSPTRERVVTSGFLTRDRAIILVVATATAVLTFAVAWLVFILLGS